MKNRIINQGERWVVCPICGKKIQKTRMTNSEFRCDCGTNITVVASRDFVTTIIYNETDHLSIEQRLNQYCNSFMDFTK